MSRNSKRRRLPRQRKPRRFDLRPETDAKLQRLAAASEESLVMVVERLIHAAPEVARAQPRAGD